jgi:choline dehydrogenase-like flavoprotein
MPSSMGVNPSLTIAANALRVAEVIARRRKATT